MSLPPYRSEACDEPGAGDPVKAASEAGLAVVPADMDKRPKVRWKHWYQGRQTDDEIQSLGHGSLWAVVTGDLYGFVVLDFDGAEGLATMVRLGLEPHVRTATGAHVYVEHPGHGAKSSAKAFSQYPGLDIKGDKALAFFTGRSKKGTYEPVSWPPVPVELDSALAAELFPHPQEQAQTNAASRGTYEGPGSGEPEAARYLKRACDDVRGAEQGASNSVLNKVAFAVGGLVASGQLNGEVAFDRLLDAARERGAGTPEVVIRSAMETGEAKPWKFDPDEDEWVPAIAVKMFRSPSVPEPVPFPIEALPDALGDLVTQGSLSVSCPPDYLGAGLLPVLGVAIGGEVSLQVTETWSESALVYVALVGPPGARKSPAIDLLMKPVWEAERSLEDAARAEAEEADWKEVEPPQIVVDDSTIEALFGVLERNPRGVILQPDELIGWIAGMNQYKGGLGRDRQHWLSIWSRRPIKVSRVKAASRTIRKPYVSVLGGVQPEPLEDLMHGRDDGLLPRLLMAKGEFVTPKLRRGVVDPAVTSRYADLWNRLRDEGAIEQVVRFTEAGFDRFESWVNEHYKTLEKLPPELSGAWAKMDGQACRLCLILARVMDSDVTPEIVERAVALVRYFQGQAAGLLTGAESGSPWEKKQAGRLKALARYIQDNPGATRSELLSMGPEWALDTRTLDRMLETLTQIGLWNG